MSLYMLHRTHSYGFPHVMVEQYYQKEMLITSRCVYLDESSTERLQNTLGQGGLCAVSEGPCQKQRGLLLNGWVLVVHHSQDVL